jgi:hypothetical protein
VILAYGDADNSYGETETHLVSPDVSVLEQFMLLVIDYNGDTAPDLLFTESQTDAMTLYRNRRGGSKGQ